MSQVTVTSPDGAQTLTTSPANARDLVQHAKWVVQKDTDSHAAVVKGNDPRQIKKIKEASKREAQDVINNATDGVLNRGGPEAGEDDGDE